MRRFAIPFALLLLSTPALADGIYRGASSVAGGRDAVCAGVTFMTATVSGSDIRLDGALYEGAEQTGSGTVKSDGSFTATKPTSKGAVTVTGKVANGHVVAQWKGPDCYGALDLER